MLLNFCFFYYIKLYKNYIKSCGVLKVFGFLNMISGSSQVVPKRQKIQQLPDWLIIFP